MKKLAIIGSGDLGQQIAWHAQQGGRYSIAGFFDDFRSADDLVNGLPILGNTNQIETLFQQGAFEEIIIAIGYKHFNTRAELYNEWKGKIPFATIIHPSAYVDSSAEIEEGCVVYPGCVIDMNARLHANVLVNAGCVIAHDSAVGKHSFLSPAVKIAGFVHVGECVSFGIGSIVIDNLTICSNARTGAGAVVIDSIDQPGLYVGVPAKIKKTIA